MVTEFPSHIRELSDSEIFHFNCHPGIDCFTDCCRELELALTPYDALRLRKELKLSSAEFLEQYCLVEYDEDDLFPRVYLGMVDDGKASCPFVTKKGCTVYGGRPGACRIYPLGRGASRNLFGQSKIIHILLTEPHCHGFSEPDQQTIQTWTIDQGLESYNRLNDEMMTILQHVEIKNGIKLSRDQQQLFLNTLYNLDGFLEKNPNLEADDDEALLKHAIHWLKNKLFA